MRKIIYGALVSLDGFSAGPNGELDWGIIDEELHRFVNDQERKCGAFLYGRRMYEVMTYWQTVDADPSIPDYILEYAQIWKSIPNLVFSQTLEQVVGNSTLVREDPAQAAARLKAQPGKDLGLGGATLAAALMRQDLIDEYQFYIHPVILGSGLPMLSVLQSRINLKLVETHLFGCGVVFLRYQR